MVIRTDIDSIVREGEGLEIEFKSWIMAKDMKERIQLASEELMAFSNAKGGTVYFGIEDSGDITGCTDYDVQNLIESVYNKTVPPLFIETEVIDHPKGTIIALGVDADGMRHALTDGRCLKRLGKVNKPYYPDEGSLVNRFGATQDFSSRIIKESTVEDIDSMEVYKLKQRLKSRDASSVLADSDDLSFLQELRLLRNDNNVARLTVAGMLFVGKEASIIHHLPQAEVIYLHYSDSSPEQYDARLDMRLPLITVLDKVTERIQITNRIMNVQVGLFRLEIQDFPENVFQEALLNALSHRDYERMGAVYIKHYQDRIIIENPGGFLDGITKDNIITHPSAPRNKLIAETLQSLKYVQRSGQGVDIIFHDMVSMGKPYPEYNDYPDAITLSISSSVDNPAFIRFVAEEQDRIGRTFSLPELMVLRYLIEARKVMLGEIMRITQLSVTESKKTCNSLIENGLIELSGKNYMLTARVYSAVKSDVEYTKDQTMQYIRARSSILDYLDKNESVTNQQIQELCGFTRQQARSTIDKMKAEGLIEMIGKRRGAKYIKS